MNPKHLRYSENHEWVRDDGGVYVVGITAYAAEQLGDIT
jgi:glycine cleavage system H protein